MFLLGVAYLVTGFSIDNVFLAQTPKLNPFFVQKTLAQIQSAWSRTKSTIAFNNPFRQRSTTGGEEIPSMDGSQQTITIQQQVAEALTTPLTQLSQGVYAGEENDIKVFEVRIGEMEYLEYTFNIKGKEVKIKVPKGQQPPPESVLETIYK